MNLPPLIQQLIPQNKLTAFSYTIFYFTKVDTTPMYNCGNILGRILWDGPLTPGHLAMLILFEIFETSFGRIEYLSLWMGVLLETIFRSRSLTQRKSMNGLHKRLNT